MSDDGKFGNLGVGMGGWGAPTWLFVGQVGHIPTGTLRAKH